TVEHLFRLDGKGTVRKIPGNYSAYLELRERVAAVKTSEEPASSANEAASDRNGSEGKSSGASPAPTSPAPKSSTQKKLSYKEQRELEHLEQRISDAEARQTEVEAEMAASPSDFEMISRLSSELEDLTRSIKEDVNRWAELAERA
ncbi:MAG: ABC transporter C-terminal domain-containing protein, partial [Rhodothermales bacterium]